MIEYTERGMTPVLRRSDVFSESNINMMHITSEMIIIEQGQGSCVQQYCEKHVLATV